MKKATIKIKDLSCPSCLQKINHVVNEQNGVEKANVFFNAGKVKCNYNPNQININKLTSIIEDLGFEIEKTKEQLQK